MKVQEYLREQNVEFQILDHRPTYDAQRMAQAVHVSGEEVAKTVLLRSNEGYAVAVLQATHRLDLAAAQQALGVAKLALATEKEMKTVLPANELGALPPFGSLYGMRTLVDTSLSQDEVIVFEGNTHHESIRMRYEDFVDLEQPLVAEVSHHE